MVLENGEYRIGVVPGPEGLALQFEGKAVCHVLEVRGFYRLPFAGTLLRNFWAKRKGALLYNPYGN